MTHANCALELLHLHQSPHKGDPSQPQPQARGNEPPTSILGIAYHNLAVEQEFLGHLEGAIRSYERAYEVRGLRLE